MKETFRHEKVKCGKPGFKRCPHGPYWYAYWKVNGTTKKRYVGKKDPRVSNPEPAQVEKAHPHDAIFGRRTGTLALACEILGFRQDISFAEARTKARKLLQDLHPDRGGDQRRFKHVNEAWSFLRTWKGWA